MKVLQIWLKMPIFAPKFLVLGIWTPNIIFFCHRDPKGTSLAETAHFEPLSVAIGPAVSPGRRDKNTKRGEKKWGDKGGIGPAHAINPILTIFGMLGGPLDMFLKFEFWVGRSPNVRATDETDRLYNSLKLERPIAAD